MLDIGKPVAISELAEQMIRLAGKRPGIDIQIQYTGLCAGEKLHESLFHWIKPIPIPKTRACWKPNRVTLWCRKLSSKYANWSRLYDMATMTRICSHCCGKRFLSTLLFNQR